MNTPESSAPRPPAAPGAGSESVHQCLSALADGDADAAAAGCARWRDDAEARERWHVYHLIGDVLRSDELASAPTRDAAFLAAVRARLAHEPVPLAAPASGPTVSTTAARSGPAAHRLGWRAPAAVAAGFMLVAGVLVLTQRDAARDAGPAAPRLASVPAERTPAAGPVGVVAPARVAEPRLVLSGDQIRDANLDAYLRAHQTARVGSPMVLPGGDLRNVELNVMPAGVGAPGVGAAPGPAPSAPIPSAGARP